MHDEDYAFFNFDDDMYDKPNTPIPDSANSSATKPSPTMIIDTNAQPKFPDYQNSMYDDFGYGDSSDY